VTVRDVAPQPAGCRRYGLRWNCEAEPSGDVFFQL